MNKREISRNYEKIGSENRCLIRDTNGFTICCRGTKGQMVQTSMVSREFMVLNYKNK